MHFTYLKIYIILSLVIKGRTAPFVLYSKLKRGIACTPPIRVAKWVKAPCILQKMLIILSLVYLCVYNPFRQSSYHPEGLIICYIIEASIFFSHFFAICYIYE